MSSVIVPSSRVLPSIVIQDAEMGRAYVITSDDLASFKTEDVWGRITPGTATFVVGDSDLLSDVSAHTQTTVPNPDVLVEMPGSGESFFIDSASLNEFAVDLDTVPNDFDGVAFVMPRAVALFEELPAPPAADLQFQC